jgi:tRNA G18 (ribose-2'-O)-methylase SpoU
MGRAPARLMAGARMRMRSRADLPAARGRTIAVLGHERAGIPAEALDLLDLAVEIPMIGTGASLNVAVAGSLVLYRLAGFL